MPTYSEDDYRRKLAREYRAEQNATEWAQAVRLAKEDGLLTVIEIANSHPRVPLMYCLPGQNCWKDVHRR